MPKRCSGCHAEFTFDIGSACPDCGQLLTSRSNRSARRYVIAGFLLIVAMAAGGYLFADHDLVKLENLLFPAKKVCEANVQLPPQQAKEVTGPSFSVNGLGYMRELFEKNQLNALNSIATAIQTHFERDSSHESLVFGYSQVFDALLKLGIFLFQEDEVYEASVQPPPNQAKEVTGPTFSIDELRDMRELFEKKQFNALNSIATEIQTHFERDSSYEHQVLDFFRLFDVLIPEYKELLDEWVKSSPSHFAPYLARARYYCVHAWQSRGHEFAPETSEQQFKGMHDYFEKAIKDLDSAQALNPRLLLVYTMRIDISNAEGDDAEENDIFNEARRLFPNSYLLYHAMIWAKAPRWGGSYAEMDRIAELALENADNNPRYYTLFGKIYVDQAWYFRKAKKYETALALCSKAISYGPDFDFYEERGRTYYFMHKYVEALQDLNEAVRLRPAASSPYTLRASVYVYMQDMENAKKEIRFFNQQFPGDAEVQRSNGLIANQILHQGHTLFKTDLKQAIARYDMVIDMNGKSAEAFYWRGFAHGKLNNLDLALADMMQAIEVNPHYFEAYRTLDYILATQRKWDEIIENWNRFLALEPDKADAYFERAGAYKHKGDMQKALADLDRACYLGQQEACKIRKRHQ